MNITSEGILSWAITDDVSGTGVPTNYQDLNGHGFYRNFDNGPPSVIHSAFQMKVDTLSGSAPELSAWAMVLVGFAGLGYLGLKKAHVKTEAAIAR